MPKEKKDIAKPIFEKKECSKPVDSFDAVIAIESDCDGLDVDEDSLGRAKLRGSVVSDKTKRSLEKGGSNPACLDKFD